MNDCVLKTLGERLGSKGKSPFLGSEPLTSQSTVTVHYHSANWVWHSLLSVYLISFSLSLSPSLSLTLTTELAVLSDSGKNLLHHPRTPAELLAERQLASSRLLPQGTLLPHSLAVAAVLPSVGGSPFDYRHNCMSYFSTVLLVYVCLCCLFVCVCVCTMCVCLLFFCSQKANTAMPSSVAAILLNF